MASTPVVAKKFRVTTAAQNATNALKDAITLSNNAKYDTSNPFGFITDESAIGDALNSATKAAYDQQRAEAQQSYNRAEDTQYSNTKSAIQQMRNSLYGSASSGANVGAANATALQGLLGLGQQNTALTTEALQNISNIEGQKAAALAQNAVDTISQANAAKGQQATAAGEKYASDKLATTYAGQGLGDIASEVQRSRTEYAENERTNASQEAQNKATNKANKEIAKTTQKSVTKNYNYDGKAPKSSSSKGKSSKSSTSKSGKSSKSSTSKSKKNNKK